MLSYMITVCEVFKRLHTNDVYSALHLYDLCASNLSQRFNLYRLESTYQMCVYVFMFSCNMCVLNLSIPCNIMHFVCFGLLGHSVKNKIE